MTLHFPDINVWLSLTVAGHSHGDAANRWLGKVRREDRLVFSRYTQMGLLRLLTNTAVMQEQVLNTGGAWAAFDAWMEDPRVEFYPEPRAIDPAFRRATERFSGQPAHKWIGDCYLLAFAREAGATLVTFDQALLRNAEASGHAAIVPS